MKLYIIVCTGLCKHKRTPIAATFGAYPTMTLAQSEMAYIQKAINHFLIDPVWIVSIDNLYRGEDHQLMFHMDTD